MASSPLPPLRLAALALPLVLPAPALAQAQETTGDEPATVLAPVAVEGRYDGTGPVAGRAVPISRTGLKTGAPVTEAPQSVTVVGREELELFDADKLDGALGYVAGVQGQPYGYDSDTNWLFIRGFDATQTGQYQDGLPHYSYGFGGFYIDPVLVERVEVLKGPASVLYGGSNPGGIVNYVSRVALPGDRARISAEVDAFGAASAEVDVNRQLTDVLAGRIIGKLERTDGHGAFDPGWRAVVAPSLTLDSPGGTVATVGLSYTHIDEDHVGGSWLPYFGTEKATQFGRIDREFNTSDPQYDYYKRDQLLLSGEVSHDFGGVTVTNVSRFGWAQVEESAPYAYGWGSGAAWTPAFDNHFQMTPVNGQDTLSRIFFEHETQTLTALNDLRAETTATTGPLRHELLFGADFKWFALDQVQASVSSPDAPAISTRTPRYGGLGPISPVPYIDNEIEQTGFGLYVQDRIRFGDGWLATLNGRHDWVTTEATGTPAYDQSDAEFSWRVGLAKTLGFGLTPYVSAATFFNPLVGTAANGPLHPETGRQIEAGLKYEPAFMDALFTASVFRIEREGVVTGPFNAQTQIGEATSQGLELEGRGRILPNLTFAAAATFMDVDISEDANAALIGKTPVATIQQQVAARLSWETPWVEGLTLTGGVRWQGDSWADDANTLKVSGRTLFDAAIAYRLTPDAQLKLSVTNLTDETYVASCDGALSCYYGEGRRVSLNLTQAF